MQKVLIVDDDTDLLEMVEMALKEQGFTVSTLTEAKFFFTAVKSFKPDVILLDIFLDDADGRELCYQLKSDSALSHIPVALYSAGHITSSSIVKSKADTFINKPFDIMELGEKIRSMFVVRGFGTFRDRFLHFLRQYLPLSLGKLSLKRLIKS